MTARARLLIVLVALAGSGLQQASLVRGLAAHLPAAALHVPRVR